MHFPCGKNPSPGPFSLLRSSGKGKKKFFCVVFQPASGLKNNAFSLFPQLCGLFAGGAVFPSAGYYRSETQHLPFSLSFGSGFWQVEAVTNRPSTQPTAGIIIGLGNHKGCPYGWKRVGQNSPSVEKMGLKYLQSFPLQF